MFRAKNKRNYGSNPKSDTGAPVRMRATPRARMSREAIARRAYDKYLARGGTHGDDQRDWYEAEREFRAELSRNWN